VPQIDSGFDDKDRVALPLRGRVNLNIASLIKRLYSHFRPNGVVDKAQPITTQPNLLNNFIFTLILTITSTAKLQSQYGKINFITVQMPIAKTLSP
jgi:hypothetical protein